MVSRRKFLRQIACSTLAGGASPLLFPRFSYAAGANFNKHLIVVQLAGGFDFHFGVPFHDSRMNTMVDLRGPLAVTDNIRAIDSAIGLNELFDPIYHVHSSLGNMKFVNKLGFACQSRSHHNAQANMSMLQCATVGKGWIRRAMDLHPELTSYDVWGFNTGNALEFSAGDQQGSTVMLLDRLSDFTYLNDSLDTEGPKVRSAFQALLQVEGANRPEKEAVVREAMSALDPVIQAVAPIKDINLSGNYGEGKIGSMLKDIGRVLVHKKNTGNNTNSIIQVTDPLYDTHNKQAELLPGMLTNLAQGLAGLIGDLQSRNIWNNVVILVMSEFGRTVTIRGNDPASYGTDHGLAGMPIIMGGKINGGSNAVAGDHPTDAELRHSDSYIHPEIDPRNVYAPILEWMGMDADGVLGTNYSRINLNLFRP